MSTQNNSQEQCPWDDLDKLTSPQNFTDMVGVRKVLSTVPVRKPNDQTYFRVHPLPEYRKDFFCVELKDDRELYIVHPDFVSEIDETQLSRRTFFLCVTRQGVVFLWPVKLPDPDGRRKNEWAISARIAAEQATKKWTRIWSNMRLGAYEHCYAETITDEPVWPDLSLPDLFKIAFRGKDLIASHDHPVMKFLRGEQ